MWLAKISIVNTRLKKKQTGHEPYLCAKYKTTQTWKTTHVYKSLNQKWIR